MLWGVARRLGILAVFLAISLGARPVPAATEYRLADAEILTRSLTYVKQNYVDPQRIDPWEMLRAGFRQLQRAVPEILATFDDRQSVTVTVDQATRRFGLAGLGGIGDLTSVAKEILGFTDLHYHGKTEARDLEYTVVDGMLNALDPHSALLTPKIYNEFKIGTKGNFGGIGIAIGSKEGQLTVIAPIEGTPAWRSGLKANDRIMQIGEESTINMSLTEAVEKLRGRVGTSVGLTVERPGRPPFSVTLKRAIIQIDSVQSALLTEGGRALGYVKIKSFQENTDTDFAVHLSRLRQQAGGRLPGLILDLRNNPGGLLQQAVAIADHFLAEGVIVSTVGAHGRFLEQDTAHQPGTEEPYPLVVLVNEGSASASEIVAGALQFHRRALVVGTPTFGKGSVQTVYDMRDGSALKLTIAEYLTGGKQSIQSVGVMPDVELVPVAVEKSAVKLLEDKHPSERDLEKHLKEAGGPVTAAAYRLRYLTPVEPTPSEEEATRSEYSNKLDVAKDFPVQFARQIVAASGAGAAPPIQTLATLVRDVAAGQAAEIELALRNLGINWRGGPAGGRPQLQVTYQLLTKEGQPLQAAAVGEEVQLLLTARNVGSGHFYQLIGSTQADEPFLDGREFVFGDLGPGASRNWAVTFKAPSHLATVTIPVAVAFQEANLNRPAGFTAMVPLVGNPRPRFAYSYTLGPPAAGKARAQGLLPVGRPVSLTLAVKNIGRGSSADVAATIKNLEGKGPFIETGRVKLGRLAPGATARAAFRIRLDPGFEGGTFRMELGITDIQFLETISNPLEFTVGAGTIQPAAGVWYQGPQIQVTGLTPPVVTTSARQRIAAQITDDRQVKDCLIFVGDEKVYYQANAKGTNTFPIDVDLPLKVGTNLVTIAARDENDLMSRQTVLIVRTAEHSTALKQ